MSFDAKNSQVQDRKLKVQRLVIPFTITGNATPASKSIASDEPSLLFLKVEGIDQITEATGALEDGETLPSLASATDSTGVINALVKIGEPLKKVCLVRVVGRDGTQLSRQGQILAFTTGSDNAGQSVVCNITTGVNLTSASIDAALEVEYVVE